MQSFSMQGQERVHHVNFLRPHQRGVQHFSLPEYSENSGKCISITLSTQLTKVVSVTSADGKKATITAGKFGYRFKVVK